MDKKTHKTPVGWRYWLVFILIGLSGQFAWAIENMYLNTFITYLNFSAPQGQTFDYSFMIALTTALSAITAMLTTIFMGALVDKLRKRKIFITVGYLLWGVSTASFGLLNANNAKDLIPVSMTAFTAATLVILLDCIMTFFGSTSNDAAFNAYVTKNTKNENRGKVEGVLNVLPLVAMLIIFVFLNNLTTKDSGYRWDLFFYIIGGTVFVIGLISIFLIPKEKEEVQNENEKYFSLILDGFKWKSAKRNPRLYIVFTCYLVEAIAMQVFFPYLMVYIERTLNIANSGSSLMTPFAIVMACALLIGSLLSVLFGFLSDKLGKVKMILPSLGIQLLSLLMMFFATRVQQGAPRTIYAAFSGILLILGYVLLPTLFNALIREDIPQGKEGSYMGVRMLFVVALPMLIGPFIGDALNSHLGREYLTEHNEVSFLPSEYDYLVAFFLLFLMLIPLYFLFKYNKKHSKNNSYLVKNLKKDLDPIDENKIPLSENSYKQLERKNFLSLNGIWECVISEEDSIPYTAPKIKVRVPYAIESPQSFMNHALERNEKIYYFKTIKVPENYRNGHTLLQFDGVDQIAEIFINGASVFKHIGGYTSFKVEVSSYLKEKAFFDLIVKVIDQNDTNDLMRGKQSNNPWAFLYSSSSGIYKSVSLIHTPEHYVEKIDYEPDYDAKKIKVLVHTNDTGVVFLSIDERKYSIQSNTPTEIDLSSHFHPWTLEDPYLYKVHLQYQDDEIDSYFALRKFHITSEKNDHHFYLNNKRILLNGLLDQGYYEEGGLTPKDFSEYETDVKNMKRLGYNCVRVHVKTEMDLFYYFCDKYGLLVIQDIPNGGERNNLFFNFYPRLSLRLFNHSWYLSHLFYGRKSKEGRERFVKETEEIIRQTKNHPSIILYTLFNESWGEFDPKEVYLKMKETFPTLCFDTASGWLDTPYSDVYSVHSYTLPHRKRKDFKANRLLFLSEVGGLGYIVKDHFYYPKTFSHSLSKSSEELTKRYASLYDGFIKLMKEGYLEGVIYTELSDCEGEVNGLYTLDRKVLKVNEAKIREINKQIDLI